MHTGQRGHALPHGWIEQACDAWMDASVLQVKDPGFTKHVCPRVAVLILHSESLHFQEMVAEL